ncbi:PAS domain S-box protein [Marinobacterium sp. CAU 1594]|nr:PAS domain S-box protein [Marinobacterium arenosum]
MPDHPTPQQGRAALTDDAERNRLLAEMAEQSTDMISRHTPGDWRFIYASPAVTHLLGYSVEEIIGLSAYDLYHPDDVEDFKKRAPSVSYERGLYTHTYRFRCKDGHYTWLESTSRSLRDADTGELIEILVVSRDASRRIKAEQANRRMARVLEISSDLVCFANPDGHITYLNEAARQTLGCEHPELTDLQLGALFPAHGYQQLTGQALPAAGEQGRWRGEIELWSQARQRPIPVMLELLAHRSLDGRIDYYSLVARDLSGQKAAEAAQRQHQAELSHATRLISIGEMASGLAHELNQPLTAINNYVQGILRRIDLQPPPTLDELRPPLERIGRTSLRSGEIIHRMMDFARKSEPQRLPQPLPAIVDELLDFCQYSAKRHNVQLSQRLPAELPAVIADRVQLEQVLLNLLINALEACSRPEQQTPLQVWLDASAAGNDQVIIRVCDQGPGLPDSDSEQLFEQFVTTKPEGLGLGLAISRSLIEAHGGQLWAENRIDGGACFCFTLHSDQPASGQPPETPSQEN